MCKSGGFVKHYDKYVCIRSFQQLLLLTAILAGVNWINLAVRGLDQLVSAGQAPSVIAEYFLLLLPRALENTIPFSVFVALTYLYFRMHADREVTALLNIGMGPARLMGPFVMFGFFGALLSTLLVHVLEPASRMKADELGASNLSNLASRQIKHRQFQFPVDGLALYVAEASAETGLENVFIHDARDTDRERTYFAQSAKLIQVDQDPVLELNSGHVEEWNSKARRLETLDFDFLRFTLSKLIPKHETPANRLRNMSSIEILTRISTVNLAGETDLRDYLHEIHDRIAKSLRSFVYPLMGVSALLLADALGIRQRYMLVPAILAVVIIHVVGNYMEEIVAEESLSFALIHAHHAIAVSVVLAMLLRSVSAKTGVGGLSLMLRNTK